MRRIFTFSLLAVIIFAGVGIVSLPKALLIDRMLSERGVYLMAEDVREDLTGVTFGGVRLFVEDGQVAVFDSVRVGLRRWGIGIEALCGDGGIYALAGYGEVKLRAISVKCLSSVGELEADLTLKDEEMRGKLHLKGIEAGGLEADRVELFFEGDSFRGTIERGDLRFEGGGTFRLNLRDIWKSRVKASFRGDLGKIVVEGELKNPRFRLR